ncbi:uncharacterized protein BCR38DRAFT_99470 [Pseudomassariella vexata]|uniref:Store-operated calcium entry-associated regulatory factor n=1 Tax=Pseudomassariella vexata TaxID=1141098 RepID=A0A1Y2EEV6_9PEZI|nr:uncharacterized protein BCR38DRAFT_99470 [Pseudomassariella vexata]ORY70090.1 hypothetical protein BCR38DRAFT_99470 [Pseudomassariella vexata]
MHLLTLLTPLLLLSTSPARAKTKPKNAILLSEVQSLTLRANAQTTHRRVSAIPQLKCISHPSICRLHEIDVLRCTNEGSGYDSEDIQWSCQASLPPELKLGSTDVICEGYSGPEDEYVLKGSCGVEYRLALTDEGERKHPNLGGGSGGPGQEWDLSAWLFGFIFVGVCAWILYSAYTQAQANRRPGAQRRPRNNGGGGGGGGYGYDDSNDDPPPPYPGAKPSGSRQAGGWQPGFWTGAAAGAAGGYFAGRGGNNRRQSNYGTGWGSGNNSGWGAGPSRSSSSSSSGSASAARHESTGFGGTSRR